MSIIDTINNAHNVTNLPTTTGARPPSAPAPARWTRTTSCS